MGFEYVILTLKILCEKTSLKAPDESLGRDETGSASLTRVPNTSSYIVYHFDILYLTTTILVLGGT